MKLSTRLNDLYFHIKQRCKRLLGIPIPPIELTTPLAVYVMRSLQKYYTVVDNLQEKNRWRWRLGNTEDTTVLLYFVDEQENRFEVYLTPQEGNKVLVETVSTPLSFRGLTTTSKVGSTVLARFLDYKDFISEEV